MFNLEFTATHSLPLTHCYSFPLICQCLPVFDEICHNLLNFVRACVKHEAPLIRLLALYGLTVARSDSFFSRNVLFCADRYCCTVSDILQGLINNINSHVQFITVDVHL